MSKSQYTNRKLKLFVAILVLLSVLAVAGGVLIHYYFGHAFSADGLSASFGKNLLLGRSFTIDDVLEDEDYRYGWAKSAVLVNVFAKSDEGEYEPADDKLLFYEEETRTFTVRGVGKGKIVFRNPVDTTVSLEVPFETKFASADTERILKYETNYPSFYDDGIVEASEIYGISALELYNGTHLDCADFQEFTGLRKIYIRNAEGGEEAEPLVADNLALAGGVHVYVSERDYLEFTRANEFWSARADRIFVYPDDGDSLSLVFEKNGGTIENDNGLAFETKSVAYGASVALSQTYAASRTGYTFLGWTAHFSDGTSEHVDDSFRFTQDAKLTAGWKANTYTLTMYGNNGTETKTEIEFQYDETKALPAQSDIAPFDGYLLLGWADDPASHKPLYEPGEEVKNLTAEQGAELSFYAVWVKKNFLIEFYNGSALFATISAEYGKAVVLRTNTRPTDEAGIFEGWASSPDATAKEYDFGQSVEGLYATPAMNGVVKFYAVFNLSVYNIEYYDGSTRLKQETEIPRGQAVTLLGTQRSTGYKFRGWRTENGVVYTDNKDYYEWNTASRVYVPNYYLSEGLGAAKSLVKLYAVWEANTFTIRFNPNGADSIFANTTAQFGNSVSFTGSTSKTGHDISSFYSDKGNVDLGSTRYLTASEVRTLYLSLLNGGDDNAFTGGTITFTPRFAAKRFTLSISSSNVSVTVKKVTASGTEIGSVSSGGAIYYGDRIKISYSANKNYNSPKCYLNNGSSSISNPTTHIVTGNVSLKASATKDDSCFVAGSLISMPDGTQKKVENLTLGEEILTFNHFTGAFDKAPVVILFAKEVVNYPILNLTFANGTVVKVVNAHGFYDLTLNEYVMFDYENAISYIGHSFFTAQYRGTAYTGGATVLVSADVTYETTMRYTLVTAEHIDHVVNGLLAVSDETEGLFNVFAYDENMRYDGAQMQEDIARYGLADYNEWSDYITYKEFVSFGGQYINVALGKGLTTREKLIALIETYVRSEWGIGGAHKSE